MTPFIWLRWNLNLMHVGCFVVQWVCISLFQSRSFTSSSALFLITMKQNVLVWQSWQVVCPKKEMKTRLSSLHLLFSPLCSSLISAFQHYTLPISPAVRFFLKVSQRVFICVSSCLVCKSVHRLFDCLISKTHRRWPLHPSSICLMDRPFKRRNNRTRMCVCVGWLMNINTETPPVWALSTFLVVAFLSGPSLALICHCKSPNLDSEDHGRHGRRVYQLTSFIYIFCKCRVWFHSLSSLRTLGTFRCSTSIHPVMHTRDNMGMWESAYQRRKKDCCHSLPQGVRIVPKHPTRKFSLATQGAKGSGEETDP